MKAGICCFAWDFEGEGVDEVMGWAAESGLSYLAYAGSYHSGWFLHPHNPRCRTRLTSSALYFEPQRDLYGHIDPVVSPLCQTTDWMREVGDRLDHFNLQLYSWTIGTHNTALGVLHPDKCVRNALGDVYPHALCPSHPDVRAYLLALCRDLSHHLPVSALVLESFGFGGWQHGHHHERDLTGLSEVEVRLMDICFHPATMQAAERDQVNAESVRRGVASLLQSAYDCAPHRAAGHPQSWDEVLGCVPQLEAYMEVCRAIEDEIIHEIHEICVVRGVEVHPYATPREATIGDFDAVRAWAHGATSAQVLQRVREVRKQWPDKTVSVDIRIAPVGGISSERELREVILAAREAGANELHFYNYSEAPKTSLGWLKSALKETP
jgi:hypothetical protein